MKHVTQKKRNRQSLKHPRAKKGKESELITKESTVTNNSQHVPTTKTDEKNSQGISSDWEALVAPSTGKELAMTECKELRGQNA